MFEQQPIGVKFLTKWIADQQPRESEIKDTPPFYQNLEAALNTKRETKSLFTRIKALWRMREGIDFSSNDLLALGSSGTLRRALLAELERHPDISLYAGGSRLMDGNYDYLEETEQFIADFHKAETGLIMNSGYNCNLAIYSSIPMEDDIILFDELVHMSTHDGMALSAAKTKIVFAHNDVESFRRTLQEIVKSYPKIRDGLNSVIISVESVYSVDGDVCPLEKMIEAARQVCTKGNAVFVVDEAHATGVLGYKGAGLVNQLGLEKEVAVRLHTCGKALASSGAIILGNATVRAALLNYAHPIIYTTAPPFHSVAGMRVAYNLLESGLESQSRIQYLVKYFFQTITDNPIWHKARARGVLFIPVSDGWQTRDLHAHIVPVWTRQEYTWWLLFHLLLSNISALPVDHPTVPKGKSRIRIMFHSANTEKEVKYLAEKLCDFAIEMIDIEASQNPSRLPKAAEQVHTMIESRTQILD